MDVGLLDMHLYLEWMVLSHNSKQMFPVVFMMVLVIISHQMGCMELIYMVIIQVRVVGIKSKIYQKAQTDGLKPGL